MLNPQQATKIVQQFLPEGKIQTYVEYRNLYLFQVFRDDPLEEEMDPFYSVDKETGEFRDFSIIDDGDINEIIPLFAEAKRRISATNS